MEFIIPRHVPDIPQNVIGGALKSAIFLTASIKPGKRNADIIRNFCSSLSTCERAVGFRHPDEQLSCVLGFGADAWDRLFGAPRPKELHKFKEIRGARHKAVSTPGDLLFHIRAQRMDLCFELMMEIMNRIRDAVVVEDETHGFRYFDDRDLLGFVDGTENPDPESDRVLAAQIGDWDPQFKGGSYLVTQKYVHDLDKWNALPVEKQELIVGRKKLSDMELDDDVRPSCSHVSLNTIVEEGVQLKIVRDNMPFGNVSRQEFGTYFICYAAQASVVLQMLQNMFVGKPVGNYDRILDYSTPLTGNLFFCPTLTFLENVEPADSDAPKSPEACSLKN